jgi:serine/threonine-protein kinase
MSQNTPQDRPEPSGTGEKPTTPGAGDAPPPTHGPQSALQSTHHGSGPAELPPSLIARAGSLDRAERTRLLLNDQRQRWRRGERVLAEAYRDQVPGLAEDAEGFLDLIYGEVVLREQLGELIDPEEYGRRFPEHADALGRLLAFHRELGPPPTVSNDVLAGTVQPRGDEPPIEFGRYRILKKLGEGGMGAVYLAHDRELDRDVALKIPSRKALQTPESLERFRREAKAAAALSHPNLCPIYDVGVQDDFPYLTMAYIEGVALSAHVREGSLLPPERVAALVRAAALALHEAHQRGIVHRDLKPSNILLNSRGEPVIMDFGLARRTGAADIRLTGSNQILGTPAYMSPEQVSGDPDRVGFPSDVWSLGVVLYELLTGRLPFNGSWTEVLTYIVMLEPQPPSSLRAGLDPDLDPVCRRAMAKQPEDRYPSMAEFAHDLDRWLESRTERRLASGPPLCERTAPPPPPVPPWRRRALVIAGSMALTAGLALAAFLLWGRGSGEAARASVPVELDRPNAVAEVWIDDKPVPLESLARPLELPPGHHTIRLTGPGFDPVVREFDVAQGNNSPVRVEVPGPARQFLDTRATIAAIHSHLMKQPAEDRRYQRYFTLTHLHNDARVTEAELALQRAALSKLLNSLSWAESITRPEAVDEAGTVFAMDLRRSLRSADRWDRMLDGYPYGLKHDRYPDDRVLKNQTNDLSEHTGTDVPAVRADWFVAQASRAPLYYDLLRLPAELRTLEKKLNVDVVADFKSDKVQRAGLTTSFAVHNRLLERHKAAHGAYWRTFDFRSGEGRGNLLRYPLGPAYLDSPYERQAFHHDGGEVLFSLPNGLNGYLIVNADDQLLTKAPAELIGDREMTAGSTKVIGGLSCLACHRHGVVGGFTDAVRDGKILAGDLREKVRRLYRPADEMKALLEEDEARFLKALDEAAGPFLKVGPHENKDLKDFPEPIAVVVRRHTREIGLREAALELGLKDPAALKTAIEANEQLQRWGLGPLANGGTIRREAWESLENVNSPFQDAASALGLGTPKVVR